MALKSRLILSTALVAGLFAAAAVPAQAGVITTLESSTQNANGTYTYLYGVSLTVGSELQGTQTTFGASSQTPVPQFGTVYDFGPIIGAITTSANSFLASSFAFTTENVETNQALNTNVPDSPSLLNIRFTYTPTSTLIYNTDDSNAPSPLAGTAMAYGVASGVDNLGTFSVVSAYAPGSSSNLAYDSSTYNSQNLTPQGNNGLLTGPAVVTAVPEPASLALLGAGLIGAGMIRRRKSI